MRVETQTLFAPADRSAMTLPVTVSDTVITVGQGRFRFNGEDLDLDDDVTYKVGPDDTHELSVIGYLVKRKSDGAAEVVIDEVLSDGADRPFSFGASPYELLTRLFHLTVSAGSDLDDVTVHAIEVVSSESEPQRPTQPERPARSFAGFLPGKPKIPGKEE